MFMHECACNAGIPLDRVLGLFPTKSLANTPLLGPLFVPPVSVQARALTPLFECFSQTFISHSCMVLEVPSALELLVAPVTACNYIHSEHSQET